jgi:adenosylcobyric acid synthase
MLIIPGSKLVIEDLEWLKERGFSKILQDKKRVIVAICGGYEMMYERLLDPYGVESSCKETEGFCRFKGDITFQKEKIVQNGCYNLFGVMTQGYEIHNGIAKKRAKKKKNLYGTFVHGLFESDSLRYEIFYTINSAYKGYNFKNFKANAIEEFAQHIQEHIDMPFIIKNLEKSVMKKDKRGVTKPSFR